MSASTVETPSVDRKSHMILWRQELPLLQQAVWTGTRTGITRHISMTNRKLGKRSHTRKVQIFHALDSCRTAVKYNSFHLIFIRCKHRHRGYNYIYNYIGVTQQRKPKLAVEKHSLLSKCRFTISREHNNNNFDFLIF